MHLSMGSVKVKRCSARVPGIDMDLSEGQRAAVLRASTAPLVVLTGGPGCGKTFATRAIVELWAAQGKHVRLAAPTGAALSHVIPLYDHQQCGGHPDHPWSRTHW